MGSLGPVGADSFRQGAASVQAPSPERNVQAGEDVGQGAQSRIAFISSRNGGWNLYVMEEDGTDVQQLTHGQQQANNDPVWSPDGSQIAFSHHTRTFPDWDIAVIDPDGDNFRVVLDSPYRDEHPDWSPDGTRIVFSRSQSGATYADDFTNAGEIVVVDVDGGNEQQLTDSGLDGSPQWSPDGSRIAFIRYDHPVRREGGLFVIDADGSNLRRLTQNTHDYGDTTPVWSPDGTRIAFKSARGDLGGIFVADVDGSNLRQLTRNANGYHDIGLEWSPDGTRIAFSRAFENPEFTFAYLTGQIFVIDADGRNQKQLTRVTERYRDQKLAWSPDGNRIAFTRVDRQTSGAEIYRIDADGTNLAKLSDTPVRGVSEHEVAWSPLTEEPVEEQPISAADALDAEGIFVSSECGPGRYCPDGELQRWVMAVWLVRALEGAEPAPVSSSRFTDVPSTEWWSHYVERFADLGITKGCATVPARYCPDQPVTRAEMATFLTRAFDLDASPDAGFVDVAGNTHGANINALAAANITRGCATEPALYCPHQPVTRVQMITFIARALGVIPLPPAVEKATERIALTFKGNVFTIEPDGNSQEQLTFNDRRNINTNCCPMWLPEEQRLAFVRYHHPRQGDWDVLTMNPDGDDQLRLSNNQSDYHPDGENRWFKPVLSPDGNTIAFASFADGDYEISVMDVASGEVEQLTDNGTDDIEPVWSPDSSRIAFLSGRGLYVMDADGSNQTLLPGDASPTWSPDGTQIAVRKNKGSSSEIYVVDADGNNPQNLTNDDFWDDSPTWSPDGTQIAFRTARDGSFEIFVMDAAGNNPQNLTNDPGSDGSPAWSPDGTRIAFVRHSSPQGTGDGEIFVMDANGSNVQWLADGHHPVWIPKK